jgi:hypothetical protein
MLASAGIATRTDPPAMGGNIAALCWYAALPPFMPTLPYGGRGGTEISDERDGRATPGLYSKREAEKSFEAPLAYLGSELNNSEDGLDELWCVCGVSDGIHFAASVPDFLGL